MIRSYELKVIAGLVVFIILYSIIVLLLNFTTDIHVNDTYYVISKGTYLIGISILILFFYFLLNTFIQLSIKGGILKWLFLFLTILSLIIFILLGYSILRNSVIYFGLRPLLLKDYSDLTLQILPILFLIAMHVMRIVQIVNFKKINDPA
jgi:heme/copper-type cytochrome/quinol oxidase subunit 1